MLGQHIGRYPSVDGWVFTAAEGGPVHHRNFRRRHFHDACVTAELGTVTKDKLGKAHYDGVRFHDLRHTAASLLIAADRSLQEVKDYLGHSSIRVTSDRYAHLYPEARAAMADALDETFKNATPANLADFSRRLRGLAADSHTFRTRMRGALSARSPALTPRADDGIRTRDPNLGKVVLYQLSHVRVWPNSIQAGRAEIP